MKVVINNSYGGFSLSESGINLLESKGFIGYHRDIERHDSRLIEVVEELGTLANGMFAELKIVDIGDQNCYYIEEYDGLETVHTPNTIPWICIND